MQDKMKPLEAIEKDEGILRDKAKRAQLAAQRRAGEQDVNVDEVQNEYMAMERAREQARPTSTRP